jgi:dipeptidase E
VRFLLTSAGIKNASIRDALVELLGKPIAESSALCVPTAMYGHPMVGPGAGAWRFITGRSAEPMCELGWKSLGVLELTALPSIDEERWVSLVRETDVLLVAGGDALYLCHWMRQSGLADLLPSLREAVWVGLSAGSMVLTPCIGRTSSAGSRPPVAIERWESSSFRSFRTWITRTCRTTPWPTQNDGRPGSQIRRMRLTIRPPSK